MRQRKKKCPSTEAKGTQDGLGCDLTAPPVCWSGKDVARLALAWSQRAAAYWPADFADGLCPRATRTMDFSLTLTKNCMDLTFVGYEPKDRVTVVKESPRGSLRDPLGDGLNMITVE